MTKRETSADLLAYALEAEQTARDCGPHDIAYPHMIRSMNFFFSEALRLEKEEIEERKRQ